MKWHFQTVHHGLWDWDLPTQPNLVTITVDGRRIDAVAQVTKRGDTFVFDRVTGAPVWPIVERPVPTDSDVPGEKPFPTQPFPTKPPSFSPQGVLLEDANNLTPEIQQLAQEQMKQFRIGPIFTPPSLRGTLQRPSQSGGANWGGAAFDPATGYLLVRSKNDVGVNRVGKNDGSDPNDQGGLLVRVRGGGASSPAARRAAPGLAALCRAHRHRPEQGRDRLAVPLGEGSPAVRNHPLLKGVTLPDRLGSTRRTWAGRWSRPAAWCSSAAATATCTRSTCDREGAVARQGAVQQHRQPDDLSHAVGQAVRGDGDRRQRPERAGGVHPGRRRELSLHVALASAGNWLLGPQPVETVAFRVA